MDIPPFLAEKIQNYCECLYGIKNDERMFPYTKRFLEHEIERGSKLAGVKRIRVHDIRHSHVSMLIEKGFSPTEIAQRVGHEAIQITYHYAHAYETKGKEIASLLNKVEEENE